MRCRWWKKKHDYQMTSGGRIWLNDSLWRREPTFICQRCGHQVTVSRWAFVAGAGALTWFFGKDYHEH